MIADLIRDARVRGPQLSGSPDEQLRHILQARLRLLGVMVGACLLVLPILAVGTWLVHVPTTAGPFFHRIVTSFRSTPAAGNSDDVVIHYMLPIGLLAILVVMSWSSVLHLSSIREKSFRRRVPLRLVLAFPAMAQVEMFFFILVQPHTDPAKVVVSLLVGSTLVAFSYVGMSLFLLRRSNRFEVELEEARTRMQVVDMERARKERRSKDLA